MTPGSLPCWRTSTTLAVDAIVNAANTTLLGGGGVDGAIHDARVAKVLEACRQIPEARPGVRCPTGEARITPGFLLPARYVIHTVGPIWRGGHRGEHESLASCYRNVLVLCHAHDIRTVAFPAISCGAYGFPLNDAAAIAVDELLRVRSDPGSLLSEATLVAYDNATYRELADAIESRLGGPNA